MVYPATKSTSLRRWALIRNFTFLSLWIEQLELRASSTLLLVEWTSRKLLRKNLKKYTSCGSALLTESINLTLTERRQSFIFPTTTKNWEIYSITCSTSLSKTTVTLLKSTHSWSQLTKECLLVMLKSLSMTMQSIDKKSSLHKKIWLRKMPKNF